MIKILALISFLGMLPAQAMDLPPTLEDSMENRRSFGHYSIYQESDFGVAKGNATLFSKEGKLFGITCAHCIPYLNSLPCIVTKEEEYDDHKVIFYSPIGNIQIHPSYTGDTEDIADSKYDIALFTITGSPNVKYFDGKISTGDLQENKDYEVCVNSFGPLFSKDRSSYEESVSHQLNSPLKFNKEGFFFHPFQARDFYLSFTPTQNDEFAVNAGLLSGIGAVNLLSGDSGSVAVDSENKAIAIASAVKRDVTKVLQLDRSLEEMATIEKHNEEFKFKLVETIQHKVADCINWHRASSDTELYIFKLKEELPPLEGNDYYTPLALHSDFINQYIHNIPELIQEDQKEFKRVQLKDVDKERNSLLNAAIQADEEVGSIADQTARLLAGLPQGDIEIIDLLRAINWGNTDYDNLPNTESDASPSENE